MGLSKTKCGTQVHKPVGCIDQQGPGSCSPPSAKHLHVLEHLNNEFEQYVFSCYMNFGSMQNVVQENTWTMIRRLSVMQSTDWGENCLDENVVKNHQFVSIYKQTYTTTPPPTHRKEFSWNFRFGYINPSPDFNILMDKHLRRLRRIPQGYHLVYSLIMNLDDT